MWQEWGESPVFNCSMTAVWAKFRAAWNNSFQVTEFFLHRIYIFLKLKIRCIFYFSITLCRKTVFQVFWYILFYLRLLLEQDVNVFSEFKNKISSKPTSDGNLIYHINISCRFTWFKGVSENEALIILT